MTTIHPTYSVPDEKPGTAVIPIPVLTDVSLSMGELAGGRGTRLPIDVVNAGVQELVTALKVHPEAADLVELAVVTFATTARVELPLTSVKAATQLPDFATREDSTRYSAALNTAHTLLAEAYAAYKDAEIKVYRPTIYMLTDGMPMEDAVLWRTALDRLNSEPWAPNICVFGVAGAPEDVLRALVQKRGRAFLAEADMDPAVAFTNLFPVLLATLIQTAGAAANGSVPIPAPIPGTVPGFRPLDVV